MRCWWLPILAFVCTACMHSPDIPVENTTAEVVSTQGYLIQQQLSLVNKGESRPAKQNLWLALIRDLPPYQTMRSRTISPGNYTLTIDEYGNQYAEFDLSNHPAGTTITIDIEYEVTVNELAYDLSSCEGELPEMYTEPELHIESANQQITTLAKQLSTGKKSACEQVHAFYDHAGDELVYSANHNAWGAQATMGQMGADCTEYASLVIALSRANGIPARYYEGLLYLNEIDKDTQIAQTEHAWLDVYLPGIGWTAMDPTLGRVSTYREEHFAHYTADHIIVTTGRNPSTLRGASYWSHLYWPGNATVIIVEDAHWTITAIEP